MCCKNRGGGGHLCFLQLLGSVCLLFGGFGVVLGLLGGVVSAIQGIFCGLPYAFGGVFGRFSGVTDGIPCPFGGSLGARRVNEVVADLCAWEQNEKQPVLHLHATGQYGVQLFKDLEKEKNFAEGDGLVVKEYINNMPELLAAAALVIRRACWPCSRAHPQPQCG